MKKKNFMDNFIGGSKLISLFLFLMLYPYFWLIWLLSEDKKYTPNDLINERWRDLWSK